MRTIILLCLSVLSLKSYCQEIETDRPDQTECASVVPKGTFQLETGMLYTRDKFLHPDGRFVRHTYNYATSLLRIGFFQQAELRLELGEYQKDRLVGPTPADGSEGFLPFVIGTKIAVCEEKGIVPQTAFIGHLQLPYGNKKMSAGDEVLPSFCFSMAHTLSERFSMGYNLGMEWESASSVPHYFYTYTVSMETFPAFEVFIETFGNFSAGRYPESYFDLGAGYRVLENFRLDVSGGFALNEYSSDMFLGLGFAVRLPH